MCAATSTTSSFGKLITVLRRAPSMLVQLRHLFALAALLRSAVVVSAPVPEHALFSPGSAAEWTNTTTEGVQN